jgi:hypothetical protein
MTYPYFRDESCFESLDQFLDSGSVGKTLSLQDMLDVHC